MKRLLQITGCIILSALLSGCFIQSFQPFYTDESVIDLPEIVGEWQLVKIGNDDASAKYPEPWAFAENEITTFENNVRSDLGVTYFKIGNVTFADLTPAETSGENNPNEWWLLHVVPVHSVCRVELSAETLILTPLNGEWVGSLMETEKISLSYLVVGDEDDQMVLTATPAELNQFLEDHLDAEDAFPDAHSHTFERVMSEK